ncbi:MAG: hypothetical protein GX783_08070 [Clostridiales bacterium]|nr:hypothetical protein [Clostridiales bacterium]
MLKVTQGGNVDRDKYEYKNKSLDLFIDAFNYFNDFSGSVRDRYTNMQPNTCHDMALFI